VALHGCTRCVLALAARAGPAVGGAIRPACMRATSARPCVPPHAGNVARFINHSCEPNLLVQPVLRPGDSGLRYCVGLFAARDIPRGTELCYDYNYKLNATGKVMACHCGAKKCRGRLL
jgi:hypothetical protein